MKNKERYTKEIVDIACGGHVLAVSKKLENRYRVILHLVVSVCLAKVTIHRV